METSLIETIPQELAQKQYNKTKITNFFLRNIFKLHYCLILPVTGLIGFYSGTILYPIAFFFSALAFGSTFHGLLHHFYLKKEKDYLENCPDHNFSDLLKEMPEDYKNLNLVDLPEYKKTLKKIYKEDHSFFNKDENFLFTKDKEKNSLQDYNLKHNNLGSYQKNFGRKHHKISNISIDLSKKEKTILFQNRFEFIEDKKTQKISFNSIEYANKDLIDVITAEKFDLYITHLLEDSYQQYKTEKQEKEQRKILQEKIMIEKKKEKFKDFIEIMDIQINCLSPKKDTLIKLQEELKVFDLLNEKS